MKSRLKKVLPTLVSIAVGFVPVLVLTCYFGVPRKLIIGWGVLSYVVGVTAFKMPIYHFFVVKVLHRRMSHAWLSASQGVVSAISELGAALLFFVFVVPDMTLAQVIGFGAAAGAVEAVMLPFIRNPLTGTPLGEHAGEVIERASENSLIEWMSVLERVLAMFPHVASRGLVYISFATGNIGPALIAVSGFALIDGRAYFAHLEKWKFDDIRVLGTLYRFIALVGISQTFLFVLLYHALL